MEGNHPGGSLLYRLEEMTDENGGYKTGGKSLVYGLDCEINEDIFSACAAFAKESSLLIWDAGFAGEDLRPGWGHSTWQQGIAMRQAAGAERVLMTHYNWAYSDTFLWRQEELAGRIGVTPQALSKWERGQSLPDVSLLTDICQILG